MTDIEQWAWDCIGYNGAGDGNDYGDDLTYDLVNKTVTHNEWCMERTDTSHDPVEMEFDDDEEDGEDEWEEFCEGDDDPQGDDEDPQEDEAQVETAEVKKYEPGSWK